MIVEGLVTTEDESGSVHVAAMGPRVDRRFQRLVLRPYADTRTLANLLRVGYGVFHVTDDVELIARAAVGQLEHMPEVAAIEGVPGCVLTAACRWYAFRVAAVQTDSEPARLACRVSAAGRWRDFVGLNRAAHAVIEAAVLATRLAWCPPDDVRRQLDRLAPLVAKTGGRRERLAWAFLQRYVNERLPPE